MSLETSVIEAVRLARAEFFSRGFIACRNYAFEIDGCRARLDGERDIFFYMDEVARESLYLTVPWSPTTRKKIQSGDRSKYLDWLASEYDDKGESSFLDPNLRRFLERDYSERQASRKAFCLLRDEEMIRWSLGADAQRVLSQQNRTFASLINEMLEGFGFFFKKRLLRSSDDRLYEANVSDIKSKLAFVDFNGAKKNGCAMIRFEMFERFKFSMDLGMPGAVNYMNGNDNIQKLMFSIYVQVLFFRLIIDALASRRSWASGSGL